MDDDPVVVVAQAAMGVASKKYVDEEVAAKVCTAIEPVIAVRVEADLRATLAEKVRELGDEDMLPQSVVLEIIEGGR